MNCDWLLNPSLLSHKSLLLPNHLQWWLMPGSSSYTGKGGSAWGLDRVCCLQLIFRLSGPWKKLNTMKEAILTIFLLSFSFLAVLPAVHSSFNFQLILTAISWHVLLHSFPDCHYHSHMQTSTAIASIPVKKTNSGVHSLFHHNHVSASVDFHSWLTSAKNDQKVSSCPMLGILSSKAWK